MLRTIEEENEIRRNTPVMMTTFTTEPIYVSTGIQSPFYGEILEDVVLPRYDGKSFIKCSKSGIIGIMKKECNVQALIEWVAWDVQFKKQIKYTKIDCPFGSKKDIEGKKFKMDNDRRITVKNEFGEYKIDIDIRDLVGFAK